MKMETYKMAIKNNIAAKEKHAKANKKLQRVWRNILNKKQQQDDEKENNNDDDSLAKGNKSDDTKHQQTAEINNMIIIALPSLSAAATALSLLS